MHQDVARLLVAALLLGGSASAQERLADQLDRVPPVERSAWKARELAKLDYRGTWVDPTYNLRIEVLESGQVGDALELLVRAWRNDRPIGFVDGTVERERVRLYNPPLLVPDDKGDIERVEPADPLLDLPERRYRFREDPVAAVRQDVAHTIHVVGQVTGRVQPGKVGRTTSTFHPASGTGGDSVDGFVGRNSSGTYNTLRTSAGTVSDATTASTGIRTYLAAFASGGLFLVLHRSIMTFPTASIPDTDTISAATLSIYGISEATGIGDADPRHIVAANPNTTNALINFDYTTFSFTSFGTATFTASAYNDFTLNSSGIANITKMGVSKFGLVDAWDQAGTYGGAATNGEAAAYYYAADQTGTTNDPKLVVVHAAAATGRSHGFIIGAILDVRQVIYDSLAAWFAPAPAS